MLCDQWVVTMCEAEGCTFDPELYADLMSQISHFTFAGPPAAESPESVCLSVWEEAALSRIMLKTKRRRRVRTVQTAAATVYFYFLIRVNSKKPRGLHISSAIICTLISLYLMLFLDFWDL